MKVGGRWKSVVAMSMLRQRPAETVALATEVGCARAPGQRGSYFSASPRSTPLLSTANGDHAKESMLKVREAGSWQVTKEPGRKAGQASKKLPVFIAPNHTRTDN